MTQKFPTKSKRAFVRGDWLFLSVMLSQWCKGSIASRINLLSQRSQAHKDKVGAITLCSAHASKGLEFDHVTIINCDDSKWPHDKSDGAFFEELRLFYVAATRAKNWLTLSVTVKAGAEPCLTVFGRPLLEHGNAANGADKEVQTSLLETQVANA